ncbi:hypothetical protein JBE04_42795 [Streptomyces sp. PRKS01-29]|nr:hypothetical protein [Streptomyces sabulosicollis]
MQIGGAPAMLTVVPGQLAKKGSASAQAEFEVIAARADNGMLIGRLPVHIHGDPDGSLDALQVATGPGVAAVTWTEDDYARATFRVASRGAAGGAPDRALPSGPGRQERGGCLYVFHQARRGVLGS